MPGFRKGKVPIDRVRTEFAAAHRAGVPREIPSRGDGPRDHGVGDQSRRAAHGHQPALHARPAADVRCRRSTRRRPSRCKDWKGIPLTRRGRVIDDAGDRRRDRAACARNRRCSWTSTGRRKRATCVLLDSQRLDANGRRLSAHPRQGRPHPTGRARAHAGPRKRAAGRRGGAGAHDHGHLPGRSPAGGTGRQDRALRGIDQENPGEETARTGR